MMQLVYLISILDVPMRCTRIPMDLEIAESFSVSQSGLESKSSLPQDKVEDI